MAKQSKKSERVIFGIHPVQEALEAGKSVEKILIRQERGEHARIQNIRNLAREQEVPVQWVPEVKIERLARDSNHQGVLALMSAVKYKSLDEIVMAVNDRGETPLLIMLDGVTDVRNFGAIARTALCMGAHGIIVPTKGSAAIQGDALKTSAGALHHIPVCRVNHLLDAYYILQTYGIQGVACTEKASETIFDINFTEAPMVLIFGSEEKGISKQLLKRVSHLAKVPIQGPVSSLNVSVAVGMTLMEVKRQLMAAE